MPGMQQMPPQGMPNMGMNPGMQQGGFYQKEILRKEKTKCSLLPKFDK